MKVRVEDIASNPDNPRGVIYEWHVQELWESFGNDPISGITVRPDRENETGKKYIVTTGDHRFEVARRRGDEEVDVVVLDITKEEALLRSLQENEVRLDNEPVSFGMALCRIKEANSKLTQERLAEMFGFKGRSSVSERLCVKNLSEEAREKIRTYNTELFGHPNKEVVRSSEQKMITIYHIVQIVRTPEIYHSKIVDQIITNESKELLTVKETKAIVDEIVAKTKELDDLQNYILEGMNRVPARFRSRLVEKFINEGMGVIAIKQMIAEFNGDKKQKEPWGDYTLLEILNTPYGKTERYDITTPFDPQIIELIRKSCEIPDEPKRVWMIEIRSLLAARKVDEAITELFASLDDKDMSDEDKQSVVEKTHQTIREFGLETQVRNHIRDFINYREHHFSAVKVFIENLIPVMDLDNGGKSVFVDISYDDDLKRYDVLGKWLITKNIN